MASKLNPYLNFPGNAREAMEYYRSVFGGDLTLNTYGELGAPDTPNADNIMHGSLETPDGFVLMGADIPPGTEHTPGNSIIISLSGDDDDLRDYWERLSSEGTVTVPFEKQMWGDEFGQCTDKFGINWMVDIGQPQT
ncbi:VOC family protein [Phytoactinopolyspora alkaliphila]|uniref:VOC family protein n=1 Tax=Phytoactinopolyspora alkaliphila TaxID=1783498 RepID=A0A6N9YNL7_9ACTN|nr:VOC family protein [Phytoactinopolyspora alkaliphila]NED96661.1 VOC family protein [Phytoactinopolyspora alkaliphila]